ncbi:MAG: DNA polymerase Y family protein [Phycisphaerales bacterium]
MWMPTLPIDLLRRRDRADGRPSARAERVLIVRAEGQRRVVAACCDRAADAGVVPGLPVAQARSVLPAGSVRVVEHTPERDVARLRARAVWARRFSPLVQTDGVDGLWLDITGCAHLFGGERGMCEMVVDGLQKLGVRSRVAIADTHGCAWAIARYATPRSSEDGSSIVLPGEQRGAMAPLPIAALNIDDAPVSALADLAIDRVGQLLEIPRRVLPSRFGNALLLALDCALGHAMEPLTPIRPVAPCRSESVFDGYTTNVEAIELAVRELLDDVCDQLAGRGRGARRLVLELGRYELDALAIHVTTSVPTRDAKHLWALVRPKLERAHLGFGVERVTATVSRDALIVPSQIVRWGGGDDADGSAGEAEAAELVDVLAGRLGKGAVRGAVLKESHLPERAFEWVSPAAQRSGADIRPPGERPTTLLDPPMPTTAIALTPDGPVHRIRWQNEDRMVVACVGPARIGGEWWRGHGTTRDYFRVRCEDGVCLWVARARESGRWYVHGVWA